MLSKACAQATQAIWGPSAQSVSSLWLTLAANALQCLINATRSNPSLESLAPLVETALHFGARPLPASVQPRFRSLVDVEAAHRSLLARKRSSTFAANGSNSNPIIIGDDPPSSSSSSSPVASNNVIGSGRRASLPRQIVSSLESLGLIPRDPDGASQSSAASSECDNTADPDPNASNYRCPACSQRDMSMPNLLVHFSNQHGSSRVRGECPLCAASSRSIPGTVHSSLGEHFRRCHWALAESGSASDSPASGSTVSQESVAKLMAMGFEVDHCIYALEQNHEDLVAATNWILNNLATVGALVESKKAAAAARNAQRQQQQANAMAANAVDENNPFTISRQREDEAEHGKNDSLDVECGLSPLSSGQADAAMLAVEKAMGRGLIVGGASLSHASQGLAVAKLSSTGLMAELAVLRARCVFVEWCAPKQTAHIDADAYVRLVKLTIWRGAIRAPHSLVHKRVVRHLQEAVSSADVKAAVEAECLSQLELAASPADAALYEEVPWFARGSVECTDNQACDQRRLHLERTETFLLSILDRATPALWQAIAACLYCANVPLKQVALKCLAKRPPTLAATIPFERLCVQFSRIALREYHQSRLLYSPFVLSLLNLCLSEQASSHGTGLHASVDDVSFTFDDSSPLRLSDDALNATQVVDSTWLGASSAKGFQVGVNGARFRLRFLPCCRYGRIVRRARRRRLRQSCRGPLRSTK